MELGSLEWKNFIKNGAKVMGINIGRKQTDQFAIHAIELIKWTKKINLTAITDPYDVAVKHFLDSIAPAHMIPQAVSMLDIGSGGGFPGIPLKVLIPSLNVTLVDASRKKISFLKHVTRILKLENIQSYHTRAEDLAGTCQIIFGEQNRLFDVIISRALSRLGNFVKMALPLLAERGVIIALKGKITDAEIESVRSLALHKVHGISKTKKDSLMMSVKKYTLPGTESERSIITISNFASQVVPNRKIDRIAYEYVIINNLIN